jgi:competence protein ComEC
MGFVSTVAPRFAIASYGFDNRYHFPHKEALDSYKAQGIPVYNTADCGMISIFLKLNHITPTCYREP